VIEEDLFVVASSLNSKLLTGRTTQQKNRCCSFNLGDLRSSRSAPDAVIQLLDNPQKKSGGGKGLLKVIVGQGFSEHFSNLVLLAMPTMVKFGLKEKRIAVS